MSQAYKLHVWAQTDVGMRRKHNEDSYVVEPSIGLYAVADGMGGHDAGDVASRSTLDWLEEKMSARRDLFARGIYEFPNYRQEVRSFMEQALQDISYSLFSESKLRGGNFRMGTTLCALVALRGFGIIAHVGDSRCYLLRGGIEYPLTEDHSLVVEQYKMGMITKEEMLNSPQKNVITRALGMTERLKPELFFVDLLPRDRYILCSDGLHSYLEPGELPDFIEKHGEANAAKALVNHANGSGGADNVTVLVLAVDDENSPRQYEVRTPPEPRASRSEVDETKELPRIKGSPLSEPPMASWASSPAHRTPAPPPSSPSFPPSYASPPPPSPGSGGFRVLDHTLGELGDLANEHTFTDLEMQPLAQSSGGLSPGSRASSPFLENGATIDGERCLEVLGDCELFRDLTYQEMRKIGQIARARSCRPGEILVTQGASLRSMWLLMDGEVELFRDQEPILQLSTGGVLGDIELAASEGAICTVIVRKPSNFVELDGDALMDILRQEPNIQSKFQSALIVTTAKRLRDTSQAVSFARKGLQGPGKPR
ncbi:MAG: cyclic nucleotide-binding domain-containing protein [Myxococcales bacterium]|nr:cyclic nucleotide-binding domain-containing protein [Myxococcales bacterium]